MGRKSRDKGVAGERELARELSELFGVDARRGFQYRGGRESADVEIDIPGVHIECKRTEWFRLYEALEQAIGDAGDNIPIVAHRQNRRPWVAVVRLEDLPKLATKLYLTLAENA